MTTPRTHSLVSLAAALALTLTLGACASRAARPAPERPAPGDGRALAIRFDNEAGEHVQVYLVGARREWRLGRVEAGARTTLRIPDAALAAEEGWLQLAVLVGKNASTRVGDEPRAAIAVSQPAATMLAQRWTYSPTLGTGQLLAGPLPRARTEVPRP